MGHRCLLCRSDEDNRISEMIYTKDFYGYVHLKCIQKCLVKTNNHACLACRNPTDWQKAEEFNDFLSFIDKARNLCNKGTLEELISFFGDKRLDIDEFTKEHIVSLLSAAIKGNSLDKFKFLLERGAPLDLDEDLLIAAAKSLDITKYLLVKLGANVHANDDMALIKATEKGQTKIVKLLLSKGANVHARDEEALFHAIKKLKLPLVKCLVEAGADITARDGKALKDAMDKKSVEITNYLLEVGGNAHSRGEENLLLAIQNDQLDGVKYLVEHGANIHASNDKPLRLAAEKSRFEILKYLIESGADIHAEQDDALFQALQEMLKDIKMYIANYYVSFRQRCRCEGKRRPSHHIGLSFTTDSRKIP